MKRMAFWAVIGLGLPVVGGLGGLRAAPTLSRTHPSVSLADRLRLEDAQGLAERTKASEAFYAQGRSREELYAEARRIEDRFVWGSGLLGVWIGLAVAAKLAAAAHARSRPVTVVAHAWCVSCGRCFAWCPRQRWRWQTAGRIEPASPSGTCREAAS